MTPLEVLQSSSGWNTRASLPYCALTYLGRQVGSWKLHSSR